jgi:hypothetical protein
MGLKDTVLGWLRSTPDKSDDLEDAEIDEATKQYSSDRTDTMLEERFGSVPGEFETEQEPPKY